MGLAAVQRPLRTRTLRLVLCGVVGGVYVMHSVNHRKLIYSIHFTLQNLNIFR